MTSESLGAINACNEVVSGTFSTEYFLKGRVHLHKRWHPIYFDSRGDGNIYSSMSGRMEMFFSALLKNGVTTAHSTRY